MTSASPEPEGQAGGHIDEAVPGRVEGGVVVLTGGLAVPGQALVQARPRQAELPQHLGGGTGVPVAHDGGHGVQRADHVATGLAHLPHRPVDQPGVGAVRPAPLVRRYWPPFWT